MITRLLPRVVINKKNNNKVIYINQSKGQCLTDDQNSTIFCRKTFKVCSSFLFSKYDRALLWEGCEHRSLSKLDHKGLITTMATLSIRKLPSSKSKRRQKRSSAIEKYSGKTRSMSLNRRYIGKMLMMNLAWGNEDCDITVQCVGMQQLKFWHLHHATMMHPPSWAKVW